MKLSEFLQKANLGVADFAAMIEITPSYCYRIARGGLIPSRRIRSQIEAITGGLVPRNSYIVNCQRLNRQADQDEKTPDGKKKPPEEVLADFVSSTGRQRRLSCI